MNYWATSRDNVFSGVSEQVRHKPACSVTQASQRLEILDIETRCIILSKQRTTKTLIRLRRCAGWSVSLLFTYGIRHIFSWLGLIYKIDLTVHKMLIMVLKCFNSVLDFRVFLQGLSFRGFTSCSTVFEPPHDKTNQMTCAPSEDSESLCP